MKIEYLSDYSDFTEPVAQWLYDEFGKGIRPSLTHEKMLQAVRDTHKTKFPIRLIALENNQCVGTIAIVHNDLSCREYTPWLAALYVDPSFRKNKIGEQLVERVKDIVRDLGYNEIYLRTEFAGDYYRKRGWQHVETCVDDEYQLTTDVYKFIL